MLVIYDFTKRAGVFVAVATKLYLLSDSYAILGKCKRCHAFLVLLIAFLSKLFVALFCSRRFPFLQAIAVSIDFCYSLKDGKSILRCHSIEFTYTAFAVYFFS